MNLDTIVVLALAIGCVVDCWLNADLFATWRADVEAWGTDDHDDRAGRMFRFLSEAWLCDYCVTFHVGIAMTILWWVMYATIWPVLCCLAAIRLSRIINDLLPEKAQYERK
jgi:hypothetical protein